MVLQVGDLDVHGENIYNAAAEDAIAWAKAETDGDCPLRSQRLALTVEQATKHDLLDADGKAEVDGLPVPVMNKLLADAIEALSDPAGRERHRDAQAAERERLPELIRKRLQADWLEDEDG